MASFAKVWTLVAVAGLASTGAVRAEVAVAASQKQAACPIAMTAEQKAGIGSQREVQPAPNTMQPGPAQRIHLKLTNDKLGTVSALLLRVNGWSGGVHRLPLTQAEARHAQGWKTVHVKVHIGPRGKAEADVWVRGLTSVNSIDLVSVRYADGSKWRAADASVCRIVPDPTMLISQK